jgi:replicative DNA helicase
MATGLSEGGYDKPVEQTVLGCLLTHPDALRTVDLGMSDFSTQHGLILRALQRAVTKHGTPSESQVLHELLVADDVGRVPNAGPYLHELTTYACLPLQLGWHVEQLQGATMRRRTAEVANRMLQAVTTMADTDGALDVVADQYALLAEIIDGGKRSTAPVVPMSSFEDFIDEDVPPYQWVIPGTLAVQERVVLTAFEGSGKSTLARQIAAMVAAGRHPFAPKLRIPPKRTLLLDSENPPDLLRRGLKRLVAPMLEEDGLMLEGRAMVARDPGGTLDVRTEAGYAGLCSLIETHQPDLLCAGPVYRMTDKRSTDSWEDVATGIQQALQKIAATYGLALFLEHHAGKSKDTSGKRGLDPYGSSLWLRWSEFGLGLRAVDEHEGNVFELERFRNDREEGRPGWPDQLIREGQRGARPFWRADWEDQADKFALMEACEQALKDQG